MFKWRKTIVLISVIAFFGGLGWTWDDARAAKSCHGKNQSVVCRGVSEQNALTEETTTDSFPNSFFWGNILAYAEFNPIPEGTMLWCNIEFRENGEDYSYVTGQLLPNGSTKDQIKCMLPATYVYQFEEDEHESGIFRIWMSTTYYGDPVTGKNGLADTGPIPYP